MVQAVCAAICLVLAAGALVISFRQFQEKGYLFHNAYIWASQEERRRMDEREESKRPYYRQSGTVFLLLGLVFLMLAVYLAAGWTWAYAVYWIFLIMTIIYALLSSIWIERHK